MTVVRSRWVTYPEHGKECSWCGCLFVLREHEVVADAAGNRGAHCPECNGWVSVARPRAVEVRK